MSVTFVMTVRLVWSFDCKLLHI